MFTVISHFVVVQLLRHVWLSVTPWTAARQPFLSSQSPGACSNSCPSSRWCHPTISSSVIPFFSCLQFFPASGFFPNESDLRIRWSLVIREMQIKTTIKDTTLHSLGWHNKKDNNKCWQGWGKIGTLIHCWWECKIVWLLWKNLVILEV